MPADLEMKTWFEQTKNDPMPISITIKPITQLLSIPLVKERLIAAGLNPDRLISSLDDAILGLIKEIKENGSSGGSNAVTSAVRKMHTDFDDDGEGKVFFLNQHNIACGHYEALTSWRLVRGDRRIKYEYKCVRSDTITNTCTEEVTDP